MTKKKKTRPRKLDKAQAYCVARGVEKSFRKLFASGAIDYKKLTVNQMVAMAECVAHLLEEESKESFAAGVERGAGTSFAAYERARKSLGARWARFRARVSASWKKIKEGSE